MWIDTQLDCYVLEEYGSWFLWGAEWRPVVLEDDLYLLPVEFLT